MRKTLKFGDNVIKNEQFLENAMEFEVSEGIMFASVNFGG